MHVFFHLAKLTIPAYGLMIALGLVFANLIAIFILKKTGLDFNDLVILEAYCFLCGFVGAKILYLCISFKEIAWSRLSEADYFNQIMASGFVFYGGLIGGLAGLFAGSRIHKIEAKKYIQNFIFLIPFIHGFGRIGCFLAGCCYGIPYHGFLAVVFPDHSFTPAGVPLFPVQLVEAVALILISCFILFLQLHYAFEYTVEIYFIGYGILRAILERFRADSARGFLFGISTSQWISMAFIIIAIVMIIKKKSGHREKREYEVDNYKN